MNLFDNVRSVIAGTLDLPESAITDTTRSDELTAWDSIGHVNLMMALEQTFDLELDVESFPTLDSVPAILDYLRQRGFH